MADFSGRKVSLGLAKEAVRGTAVTPAYWLRHTDTDFFNRSKDVLNDSVLGVLDKHSDTEVVQDWAQGKIDGNVCDRSFGLVLLAALGTKAVATNADVSGLVFDHTFTESQSNISQSLTVTRKDGVSDKNYALAMLESLEINVLVGDYVRFKSTWQAKKGATGTDTVAYVSENEFKAKNVVVKVASLVAGLAGATAIPLRAFNVKISRNLNQYFVVGSNDINENYLEEMDVTGDFTLRYTDTTYEALRFNDTYQALLLDVKNTDVTIGTAANPELAITMPKISLVDHKPNFAKDKMVEQQLLFQGMYDTVTAKQISAVLTNLVASY